MGFFSRFFRREERAIQSSDPYLSEYFGIRETAAGVTVTPDRASGHSIAMRCIQTIAENLAATPRILYRRTDNGGREAATDHPLYSALKDRPNPHQTAFEAHEFMVTSIAIYGNAYARIDTNGRGQAVSYMPLVPTSVTVEELKSGKLRYRYTPIDGGTQILLADEVLHIRYRSRDGKIGMSPISLARETFGRAIAENDQASSIIRNGMKLSGAFVFPDRIDKDKRKEFRDKTAEKFQGSMNAGQFLVLDGGADFKPFSIPSKDAEFLESRKLSNLDVARVFGVPPTVAGITDNATYSNVEQESRALVVRCLAPWARRIEQAMNAALLTQGERKRLFIEHDLAALLRGDLKARYEAYRIGREWGWLSPNEIRGWENLSDIDGGDEYLSPLNMTPLGTRNDQTEV